MSESDGVPGEFEYSDDEDYIRNESVMSARRTKMDGSVAEEPSHHHEPHHDHHQVHTQPHESHEQGHAIEPLKEELHHPQTHLQEEETIATEQSQARQEKKQENVILEEGLKSVTVSDLLLNNQTSSAIVLEESIKPQYSPSPIIAQERALAEGIHQHHNNDNLEQSQEHKIEILHEQAKDEHAPTYQQLHPTQKQEERVEQVENIQESNPIKSGPVQQVQIEQKEQQRPAVQDEPEKIVEQQPHSHPKQPNSIAHQHQDLPLQEARLEQQQEPPKQQSSSEQHHLINHPLQSHPQAEHSQNPIISAHSQSQSERDLLADINVVPKSAESQFSEKEVQRKLFKTDLQKEQPHSHHSQQPLKSQDPLRSQQEQPVQPEKQTKSEYQEIERKQQGEVKNNSVHQLMTIPQSKSKPQDLNTKNKKKQDALPSKSEACKCLIM